MKRGFQAHSEASSPAYWAISAKVPSPRASCRVLRASWGACVDGAGRVRFHGGVHAGESDAVIAAHHVEHVEIVVAVAVDVGSIDAHGELAGVSQGEGWRGAEFSTALLDPEAIDAGEVVADVEIGLPVAIEVAQQDGQAPVVGRFGERFSGCVEEGAAGEADFGEAVGSLVEEEGVRFAILHNGTRGEVGEPTLQGGKCGGAVVDQGDNELAVGFTDAKLGARLVAKCLSPIIGDVEVEIAVAIDVGECQGRAAAPGVDHLGSLEACVSVVEEDMGTAAG
jgi:hypothetical protein